MRGGREEREYFQVEVGLWQGCAMLSWLFTIMGGGLWTSRTSMMNGSERKGEVSQVLFRDDTALIADD